MTAATAPFPLSGDIALMNAKPGIIAAQSIARGRQANFSHAAMAIDDEVYVDSLTDRGVGIDYWAKLDPFMPLKVLRYRPTEHTSSNRISAMLEHYGKAYNFAFALKRNPVFDKRYKDTFYCSEFVGQVFTHEELGIHPQKRMIMPSDLEALASNPNWIDVTDIYRPYVDGSKMPNTLTSGTGMKNLFEAQGQLNILMRDYLAQAEDVDRKIDELAAILNETRSHLSRRKHSVRPDPEDR
jgi:Permuted papain-like amidase enzyme, YaeF/YiiX, C92 family